MADVFISYHEDTAVGIVRRIADLMESVGITCWYAQRNLSSGGDFSNSIPAEIDSCKVFLLVLNEKSCQSKHIQNEVGLAFSRYNKSGQITIIPFQIGDFLLPDWMRYYFIHIQIIRVHTPDDANLGVLQRKIEAALELNGESTANAEIAESFPCGGNLTYMLDSHGILTISGSGPMENFVHDKKKDCIVSPWWSRRTEITHIQIDSGVTAIGEWAFSSCTAVVGVSIPNSVTMIGDCAFNACTSLTEIVFPDSLKIIGAVAFGACDNLSSVHIPDSVVSIKQFAFSGCARLTNVSLPRHTKTSLLAFPFTTTVTRR